MQNTNVQNSRKIQAIIPHMEILLSDDISARRIIDEINQLPDNEIKDSWNAPIMKSAILFGYPDGSSEWEIQTTTLSEIASNGETEENSDRAKRYNALAKALQARNLE